MKTLFALMLSTLLMASPAMPDTPPSDWDTKSNFELANTVILVHVTASTFSIARTDFFGARATARVLKSWKGPFAAGQLLDIRPPGACFGPSCVPYRLQAADEVLIFTMSVEAPIFALRGMVFPAAQAKQATAVLNQAVKEQTELHDPQTDITRAPARQRVLRMLSKCLAEVSRHEGEQAFISPCSNTDVSILVGIKVSELAAALGPPAWCQQQSPLIYVPGTGANCPADQPPIWAFQSKPSSRRGLICTFDASLRCMHFTWFLVAR